MDPVERSVLALRHAPAQRRGDPRFDPGRRRAVESARCTARASIPRSRPKCWPANRGRATAGASRRPRSRPGGASTSTCKRSLIMPMLEQLRLCRDRFELRSPLRDHASRRRPWRCSTASSSTTRRRILAARLRREAGDDPPRGSPGRPAGVLPPSRPPTEIRPRRAAGRSAARRSTGSTADAAWKYYCLMVLNLNEFVYLD